jgi:predicted dienelactone hydrolase
MSRRRGRRRSLLVLPLLAALLPAPARALPDVTKPGPFAVGVTNVTFTKTSVTTGAPRPLDTVVWYPAVRGSGTPTPLGRRDATVLRRRSPLLIFSHGLCGYPEQSTFLTAALASWGFVVAAPPHPGNRLADGIPACAFGVVDSFANRVADVRFTLDSMLAESRSRASAFDRRLSVRRIGMTGHSFGGQTTLRVALVDRRLRAALALAPAFTDTIEPGTIRIPSMIQGAELDSLVKQVEMEATHRRVEIICRPLMPALALLRDAPHVDDVSVFGQALHIRLRDIPGAPAGDGPLAFFSAAAARADVMETLRTRLVGAGTEVLGVRSVYPSLEDVFVSFTRAMDRKDFL